jgi:hypothetical protein
MKKNHLHDQRLRTVLLLGTEGGVCGDAVIVLKPYKHYTQRSTAALRDVQQHAAHGLRLPTHGTPRKARTHPDKVGYRSLVS